MPTIQTVPIGAQAAPEPVNLALEYQGMIAMTERLLALEKDQYARQCANFNRFQGHIVEAVKLADRVIAERKNDAQVYAELQKRRANLVGNFAAMQEKMVSAMQTLEASIGQLAESLHFLYAMVHGHPAPEAMKTETQTEEKPAPKPNTVEESAPPEIQSQVAEVVEANGQRTVFENGQPVLIVPPVPGPMQ